MSNSARSSGSMPEGTKRRRRSPNELVWTQPRTISPALHTNARSLSARASPDVSMKNNNTSQRKQPQPNFTGLLSPCSQPKDMHEMQDWKMNADFLDFAGPTDDAMVQNLFMSDESLFSTPQSMDSQSFSMSGMDPSFMDNQVAGMLHGMEGCDATTMSSDPRMNVSGLSGFSAIHLAAHFGKLSIIHLLLSVCPEDVDLANHEGQTPLHIAASEGHIELIPELLRSGANALLQDADSRTALHLAVLKGHFDIIRMLLDDQQGQAMVRIPDSAGRTPLHQAVMQESGQAVRLMLERGADPRAPLG
ncbi:ankyrin repeat-containing protein [Penicillium herquei]|nr:ankyrin repeat-containing protein [Penicillium herquei]